MPCREKQSFLNLNLESVSVSISAKCALLCFRSLTMMESLSNSSFRAVLDQVQADFAEFLKLPHYKQTNLAEKARAELVSQPQKHTELHQNTTACTVIMSTPPEYTENGGSSNRGSGHQQESFHLVELEPQMSGNKQMVHRGWGHDPTSLSSNNLYYCTSISLRQCSSEALYGCPQADGEVDSTTVDVLGPLVPFLDRDSLSLVDRGALGLRLEEMRSFCLPREALRDISALLTHKDMLG